VGSGLSEPRGCYKPAMRLGRSGLVLFAVASALLHWTFWVRMPDGREQLSKVPARPPIEFSVIPPNPLPPPPIAQADSPAPPPAATTPPPTRSKRRELPQQPMAAPAPASTSAPIEPAQPASVANATAPASTAPASTAPAAPSSPAAIDISPRRAANTLAASLVPSVCNPRSPVAADRCEPHAERPSAQEELTRSLQQSAHTLAHLTKREAPQLQREADGGYRFTGAVFSARIGVDGHVAFEDKAAVQLSSGGPGLGFDLNDAVDSLMKHELYSAEKRWFLDQTAAVREQLADAFRVAEVARAKRYIEQALERILAAPNDAAHKHAALFALWQDCGDDADAASVRRVVEAFVQRRMPAGSALGFDAAELERLNADRSGMRRFDPYRTSANAGSPG
jgi:hypothetical protein